MAETTPEAIIVRRRVKHARIEFTPQGLKVIVPISGSFDVAQFLERHQTWVNKKMALYQQLANGGYGLVDRPLSELNRFINENIALASVTYGAPAAASIGYRTMKNRWGSCSSRGELKFNTNLRFLPDNLISYVVFHEVCHLKVLRHNTNFRRLLHSQFPDHKQLDRDLLGYWHQIHK